MVVLVVGLRRRKCIIVRGTGRVHLTADDLPSRRKTSYTSYFPGQFDLWTTLHPSTLYNICVIFNQAFGVHTRFEASLTYSGLIVLVHHSLDWHI